MQDTLHQGSRCFQWVARETMFMLLLKDLVLQGVLWLIKSYDFNQRFLTMHPFTINPNPYALKEFNVIQAFKVSFYNPSSNNYNRRETHAKHSLR
jgi:hypothetical protein